MTDPVTIIVLVIGALICITVASWVSDIFGGIIKIVVAFAVLGLIIGLIQQPKETEEKVLTAVHTVVDLAHKIGDTVKKP